MANVKVVIESSIKPPHIQVDISLREAKILTANNENVKNVFISELVKAIKYIEKN